jgi:hypothetical protein
MQAGRFRDRKKSLGSIDGATIKIQTTRKIETSDVDHGSDIATRIATKSAARDHAAGSRQTDRVAFAGAP